MSDFKVIETQEELDKIIKGRLAQKDREVAEQFKDYLSPEDAQAMKADYEKQIEEAGKKVTEAQEKLKSFDETVAQLTTRAETAENSLLKNKIAYENKLPLELADRLRGATEEELKKDAESLSGLIKPTSAPPLHTGTQNRSSNSYEAGIAELAAQMTSQMTLN